MKSSPLVSLGMPVYNGERTVARALDSVLGQSYENLEVVISDNASTDKTPDICLEYASRDPRIRYYRNETNLGALPNFRRVLELTTGEYFTWACTDDRRPSHAVQMCVEALEKNPGAVMVHGPVFYEAGNDGEIVELKNDLDLSAWDSSERIKTFTRELRLNTILYGLYRRSALARGIFPYTLGQDYLLVLQMCAVGPFLKVETPIVIYQIRRPVSDISDNPMYRDVPMTFTNLLMDSGLRRWKCWTVLIMGSYYLFKISGIPLRRRLHAIGVHVCAFSMRYRTKMAREFLFQCFAPLAWLSLAVWRLARHWPVSFRLARRLKAILLQN